MQNEVTSQWDGSNFWDSQNRRILKGRLSMAAKSCSISCIPWEILGVSCKSFTLFYLSECHPKSVLLLSVSQECPARVSFKSLFPRVPCKTVSQQCLRDMSWRFCCCVSVYTNMSLPFPCPHTHTSSSLSFWLVVWTPLKNISQLGWLFPIYGKIKNVPNHQPVIPLLHPNM